MMRFNFINFCALFVGLLFGVSVTLAYADPTPCGCLRIVDRQPNGLPK